MPDGKFMVDGVAYNGMGKKAEFNYIYDPMTAKLTWNGESPLRFGGKLATGQEETLQVAILQLIGNGKIKLVDDFVYGM